MKKNKTMRLASILLILTLLTTSVISGTFAKYTSTTTATSTATVAKWDVKLDGTTFANTATFNFVETWTNVNNTTSGSVVANKLAPGTSGAFDLNVTNSSEVDAKFKINFDFAAIEGVLPLDITYKVGTEAYTEDTFVSIAMNETKTVTVEWVWPFERGTEDALVANDQADTALGAAFATYNVSATITAEQVD